MHVNKRQVGEFRILAVATPSSKGGFIAAVTVTPGTDESTDSMFSDLSLADGFLFKEPEAAMKHAFDVGHRQLRMHATRS